MTSPAESATSSSRGRRAREPSTAVEGKSSSLAGLRTVSMFAQGASHHAEQV